MPRFGSIHRTISAGRLSALILAALGLVLFWMSAGAQPPPNRIALIATIDGGIGPATERYLTRAVEEAEARNAEVLVLEIDTPGGLVDTTRNIVEIILASPTPVIGYVSPAGGHAASAGTYIIYSTHVAAMAPATNIGAATVVQIGAPSLPHLGDEGDEPDRIEEADQADAIIEAEAETETPRVEPAPPAPSDAMGAKSNNDAVAYIRSLAELRGRNVEWAERAVRGASALTAQEALELGVVEILADDIADLYAQLDGRVVTAGGEERTLNLQGIVSERIEPTRLTRVLEVIANPNVALLLMMAGFYGLVFEFAQPGTIGPGVIGAICLVLGLYSLNQLPLNYAGLALLLLGMAFMIGEAITPSVGLLGFGGVVAFLFGASILVDTDVPEFRLSWVLILSLAALSWAFLILVLGFVWRSFRRPVATGVQNMVGEAARVLDWSDGSGHVWVEGERWSASGDIALKPGQTVRVAGVDSLRLRVTADEPGGDMGESHA